MSTTNFVRQNGEQMSLVFIRVPLGKLKTRLQVIGIISRHVHWGVRTSSGVREDLTLYKNGS